MKPTVQAISPQYATGKNPQYRQKKTTVQEKNPQYRQKTHSTIDKPVGFNIRQKAH